MTKLTLKGLERGSAVKSICCFYLRSRFSSQHPHSSSPRDAQRSQDAHSIHIHSQAHTHTQNIKYFQNTNILNELTHFPLMVLQVPFLEQAETASQTHVIVVVRRQRKEGQELKASMVSRRGNSPRPKKNQKYCSVNSIEFLKKIYLSICMCVGT